MTRIDRKLPCGQYMQEAIGRGDAATVLQQAKEIEGWAQAIIGETEPDQAPAHP